MSTAKWRVVRFATGGYGVGRKDEAAGMYYYADPLGSPPKKFERHEDASLWADTLNGKPTLPKRMTEVEFINATMHVILTTDMRHALRRILVEGMTWQRAAAAHGVTQSGILRAMRRIAERNHPG